MLAEAHQQMVLNNINLVRHVANRYKTIGKKHGYDYEDLVSIGTIALIKSVKAFRPEFNTKLSTFAVPRIQTEIRNTINQSRSLRTSRVYVELFAKMSSLNLLDLPTEVIAEKLNKPERKIRAAIQMQQDKVISLYGGVAAAEDNDKITVLDTIPFSDDISHIHMYEFFNLLDQRECLIVALRIEGKTQDEIASELECSQVHISRLIKKIQQKWEQYRRG